MPGIIVVVFIMAAILFCAGRIILGWILPIATMTRIDRGFVAAGNLLTKLVIVFFAGLLLYLIWMTFRTAHAEDSNSGYQIVDAADLSIGSRKYVRKKIEVRNVRCYYADVDDYRCTSTVALVAIFTKRIGPENVRKWFEEKCDAVKKVFIGPNCMTHIRFTYTDATTDLVNGYQRRIVLHPDEAFLALPNVARAQGR